MALREMIYFWQVITISLVSIAKRVPEARYEDKRHLLWWRKEVLEPEGVTRKMRYDWYCFPVYAHRWTRLFEKVTEKCMQFLLRLHLTLVLHYMRLQHTCSCVLQWMHISGVCGSESKFLCAFNVITYDR